MRRPAATIAAAPPYDWPRAGRENLVQQETNWVSRIVFPVTNGDWTFLSNYGHVLVSLARDPEARMRDVAPAVGITERAAQQIVAELVGQGYLRKEKVGRRNRYDVVRGAHLRHELESQVTLGDFLELVVGRSQQG
ncbi:hypothetical protein GCM10009841_23420 [Microlunatus panaciterrae]